MTTIRALLASLARPDVARVLIGTAVANSVMFASPSVVGASESSAAADADAPPETPEQEPSSEEDDDSEVRVRFDVLAAGYQGGRTRQIYARPAGAAARRQTDAGELLAGSANGVVSALEHGSFFHVEYFRIGGVCGFAISALVGDSASRHVDSLGRGHTRVTSRSCSRVVGRTLRPSRFGHGRDEPLGPLSARAEPVAAVRHAAVTVDGRPRQLAVWVRQTVFHAPSRCRSTNTSRPCSVLRCCAIV